MMAGGSAEVVFFRQRDLVAVLHGKASQVRLGTLFLLIVGFGTIYGAAMGSSSGRGLQIACSAAKVPVLLMVSTLIGLPSFFVLNLILGLKDDFGEALRAILAGQASLAIVLASLGPVLLFCYALFPDYAVHKIVNGMVFFLSSLAAQTSLAAGYGRLIRRQNRHRWTLILWLGLYMFVAIQLAWLLRPFIGHPDMEPSFFREEAWGNAYHEVFKLLVRHWG